MVFYDPGFAGVNDYPDEPVYGNNSAAAQLEATCVHVQTDTQGAKTAVIRAVTSISPLPGNTDWIQVGDPALIVVKQAQSGQDYISVTFFPNGTGCSLADAQSVTYSHGITGTDNLLQTVLPVKSGQVTPKG
jgi:hypothetical protein